MLITIENVLTLEQVNEARQKLATAEWVDGRVTVGYEAQKVKRNAQIPENSPVAKELGDMSLAGLARSPRFMSPALPLRVFPPMFNSYAGGQTFGTHVDTAIRQLDTPKRRLRLRSIPERRSSDSSRNAETPLLTQPRRALRRFLET
jgi:PKHD-type hydroxylase